MRKPVHIFFKNRKVEIPSATREGSDTSFQDAVSGLHFKRILERVVSSLDERGSDILVMYQLDGMTQSEIARSLGISRRAVVKRLTALRHKLSRLLDEDHG